MNFVMSMARTQGGKMEGKVSLKAMERVRSLSKQDIRMHMAMRNGDEEWGCPGADGCPWRQRGEGSEGERRTVVNAWNSRTANCRKMRPVHCRKIAARER